MRWLLVLLLPLLAIAKKHHSESDEEEATQSPGEKIVDRLAVNLAGAFVKSMFPEMERGQSAAAAETKNEIRRAPPTNMLDPSMENYNPNSAMSNYNSLPQVSQMHQNGRNPFAYQSQMNYPQSPPSGMGNVNPGALNLPNIPSMLSAGGGTAEALNAVKNQQYLQELARHQSELNTYAAKQSEYLENQRRYQQAMIDHQAGAALLLQQQQQEAINEQMKQLKAAYGTGEHFSEDNTVGGRVLTRARTHGVKAYEPSPPEHKYDDDDITTNDAHLKRYFREHYGIDFDTKDGKLTDEERETLRQLKQELLRNKDRAINRGAFKEMDSLKRKVKSKSRSSTASSERLASAPRDENSKLSCPQCFPVDMKMLRGAWTQMYGNPNVIKKTFGTILALENHASGTVAKSSKKASCIGMEVGKSYEGEASFNLFFRDDGTGNPLHEMRGTMWTADDRIIMETDRYNTKMCLVKSGPSEADRYEYVILTETSGKNACRSYHVFARNTDEFNRRHFDDVSEFMNSEVIGSGILPVGAFSKSSLCQLSRP